MMINTQPMTHAPQVYPSTTRARKISDKPDQQNIFSVVKPIRVVKREQFYN